MATATTATGHKRTQSQDQVVDVTLPDKVAQFYYSLGLFCTSYPICIITVAVTVVLFCCCPLVNVPLPGTLPLQAFSPNGSSFRAPPDEKPWCYVQQVVLRSAVVPWSADRLILADAFRAPLYQVFHLLDVVRNFQHGTRTLGNLCLHVEAVKRRELENEASLLPEYNCLLLSPANFWQQNVLMFNQDSHLLTTIFNHQNIQKGKVSLAEILFGMNLKETGIKRYPLRNRQRVLQYAVTIVFKEFDEQYILGLQKKLETLYSLHQTEEPKETVNETGEQQPLDEMLYIYYPGVFNYIELVPLSATFAILFGYVYFSVRKMDLIRSKSGMAFAAVGTVLGSLSMSLGLCFFFGLTLSLQGGKEIFPYLVVLVGLENVLVLTKSVASTAQHLDVKIRIAQGLSKEGWSITKNILLEITILTIGLATFVPVIQEFCIFAIVGLISDFFLQMFFFSTILGLDIQNTFGNPHYPSYNSVSLYERRTFLLGGAISGSGISRSKSHPRLTAIETSTTTTAAAVSKRSCKRDTTNSDKYIPKRLRLVNIWARTRFFQRAFMIWMVVWISMIVYRSGIIEQMITPNVNVTVVQQMQFNENATTPLFSSTNSTLHVLDYSAELSGDDLLRLKHAESGGRWLRLSAQHWPAIFERYNVSLSGRYIAVLPAIRLAHAVSPEQAVRLRNGHEMHAPHTFKWHALAAALDPLDFSQDDNNGHKESQFANIDQPFYPNSPMEIFLATILCVISVIVLAYTMIVLYRCICTRNYAEWRASWTTDKIDEPTSQLVMEAVPMILKGHCQEIECLVTDGNNIVSSCLGGQLKVWDPTTGEQIAHIDRKFYFYGNSSGATSQTNSFSLDVDDATLSDYESGSPPSRDETSTVAVGAGFFPDLQRKINTHFHGLTLNTNSSFFNRKSFDFEKYYRQLYSNANKCSASQPQQPQTINAVSTERRTKSPASISLPPTIWCIDYVDNLIALGCANGRLEFWEGTTGKLKCIFEDGFDVGVTAVRLVGNRVISAKLNGVLDFLQLQTYTQGRQIDWGFTSAYRRTHIRTGSAGSLSDYKQRKNSCGLNQPPPQYEEDIRCVRLCTMKAHQQPVTVLDAEGERVLSGSQDHTLKLYRLDEHNGATLAFTLHGHCGPITCLLLDRICPATGASGSQDGLLFVWDLGAGACVFSLQAHDGAVQALACSHSYIVSLGADERLCVWERFQGHLLNTIHMANSYASGLLMLTHSLAVSSRRGSLLVLDVRTGETVRAVALGQGRSLPCVKQMLLHRPDTVVCDYGTQLRIIRFPLIAHKFD